METSIEEFCNVFHCCKPVAHKAKLSFEEFFSVLLKMAEGNLKIESDLYKSLLRDYNNERIPT